MAGQYGIQSKLLPDYLEHFKDREKKKAGGLSRKLPIRDEVITVAERTWIKFPTATSSAMLDKVLEHFSYVEPELNSGTVEKTWLPIAKKRSRHQLKITTKIKWDKHLEFDLVLK